jgi:hypothetical protein
MNKKERAEMDEWLRTPESDEPVPEFVERDLEEPLEIDLSGLVEADLSPDFTDRVVRELARRRAEAAGVEGVAAPPVEGGIPTKGVPVAFKPVPNAAPPSRKTPEEPARPSLAAARPPLPRAAASRR